MGLAYLLVRARSGRRSGGADGGDVGAAGRRFPRGYRGRWRAGSVGSRGDAGMAEVARPGWWFEALEEDGDEAIVEHYGSCHCGAVRFIVNAPSKLHAVDCSCSICHKKGCAPHLIVPATRFQYLAGWDEGVGGAGFLKYVDVLGFREAEGGVGRRGGVGGLKEARHATRRDSTPCRVGCCECGRRCLPATPCPLPACRLSPPSSPS